jgi:protein subunit release factor B/uncharacterized protein (UPF0248 family)
MENLYQEWTAEQDRELWEQRHHEPVILASRMGRGIRGVQARLSKLRDVNSPAYQRLFGSKGHRNQQDGDESSNDKQKSTNNKLVPVSEVLRRIEYDHNLDSADFFVLHYDRLDDTIVKSPLDAPNESISNKETSLIKALPEHRIVGVMYKERLVWDRSTKLDLIFGGGDGGIAKIVATYHEWKTGQDQIAKYEEARKEHVSMRLCSMLGVELYGQLDRMTTDLQIVHDDPTVSTKKQVETYVNKCLQLFQQQQRQIMGITQPSNLIPQSDFLALEELSQFVACWTSTSRTLQELVLWEISLAMDKAEGKSVQSIQEKRSAAVQSVELMEEDLEETFVRGSGPGGQKINKTSNRVVLIHKPTRLRVECQDTRSLQQNRKIARKRMKDKIDEYLNGSQSKVQMKHDKLARKRKQSKAKNRARQKKKQQEKLEKKQQQGEENELDSDDEDDDGDDDYHL